VSFIEQRASVAEAAQGGPESSSTYPESSSNRRSGTLNRRSSTLSAGRGCGEAAGGIVAGREHMSQRPLPSDAVDLQRFAEVVAHLRHYPAGQRAEVLSRLGLDERAWEAAVASWHAARDEELARGASDIVRRFGVAFGRAARRLDAEKPSLASLSPVADAPPPPPAPAPDATPSPVVPPPASVVPLPAPVVPPPAPVVRLAAVASPAASLAGTLPLGTELPIARLPFVSPRPAEESFEAARSHAQAVQGPARAPAALGATVGVSSAAPERPLPFGLGPKPRRPAVLAETVGLPPGVADAAQVPPGVPDLTLPQYASLRVELQLGPEKEEAILARYRVPREGRAALDDYWRGRFEADPLLRMMFAKAYATYVTWLRTNGG
jgi:hypothetical protein